ncbi:MAG: hypothetical protein HY435_03305 [Candidatus Liptonbacteria bacterium]|nr:hypothetical protein [Candidatus Liptonbacteria bacterium]
MKIVEVILKALEEWAERLEKAVRRAADRAQEILSRYARRLSRFFRHILGRLLQIAWLLFKILTILAAPLLVGSVGYEISVTASSRIFWITGWLIAVLGWGGTLLVALTLTFTLVSRKKWRQDQPAPEGTKNLSFEGRWSPFWFDVLFVGSVFVFATYVQPSHEFSDPVLRIIYASCRTLHSEILTLWQSWHSQSS